MWTPRKQFIVKAAARAQANGTDLKDDMAVWAVIDDTARSSNDAIREYYRSLSTAAETRLLRDVQKVATRRGR